MEKETALEEALLREIKAIEKERAENRIVPAHALRRDILVKVDEALGRLSEAGKIVTGDTINDRYIKTTDGGNG